QDIHIGPVKNPALEKSRLPQHLNNQILLVKLSEPLFQFLIKFPLSSVIIPQDSRARTRPDGEKKDLERSGASKKQHHSFRHAHCGCPEQDRIPPVSKVFSESHLSAFLLFHPSSRSFFPQNDSSRILSPAAHRIHLSHQDIPLSPPRLDHIAHTDAGKPFPEPVDVHCQRVVIHKLAVVPQVIHQFI